MFLKKKIACLEKSLALEKSKNSKREEGEGEVSTEVSSVVVGEEEEGEE